MFYSTRHHPLEDNCKEDGVEPSAGGVPDVSDTLHQRDTGKRPISGELERRHEQEGISGMEIADIQAPRQC